MIAAMNTSHDGSLSTVHANGPPTTPCGGSRHWRCPAVVRGSRRCAASLWSAVDLVVHLARRGSARKVETITAVDPTGCREIDNASDHVRARVFGRSI